MNCEKCQEQLSDFLDGALGHREHASMSAHLTACPECAAGREEFHAIIGAARTMRESLHTPANEGAMWMRVRNAVEPEAHAARAAASAPREGFWARLFHKSWELSLPQLASGVAALAVAVAFATTLSVQYMSSGQESVASRPDRNVRRVVAEEYYPGTYLEPEQVSLQYWQQRVEARKASWSPRMRASFDRSIDVLDESVKECMSDLRHNPHDEIAEEMLNSALRDKIELLREFGEQY